MSTTLNPINRTDSHTRLRGEFSAMVTGNHQLCQEHYRLALRVENFPTSEPGQFVEILCDLQAQTNEPRELEWQPGHKAPAPDEPYFTTDLPYLRRPFSIAGRRDGPGRTWTDIDIIHRVVGKATGILERLRPGDRVSILGPLGKGFQISSDIKNTLLVGGGVGIPPMIYLAEKVSRSGKNAVAFAGAQKGSLISLTFPPGSPLPSPDAVPVLNTAEFAAFGVPTIIATDDGSLGFAGYVTEALERFLASRLELCRANTVIYCCGPTPMMKATSLVASKFDIACQVSLEQPMACGMGTCQSCVIKFRMPQSSDWVYKLTCTDGPVFDSADIIWP